MPEELIRRSNVIDYQSVIQKYPWLVERGQNCILSPDVDGFLCGLLMTHYLDWNVVGFFDTKTLLIRPDISPKECVFLDIEILRNEIRSVGHHMNIHSLERPPEDYHQKMENCLNPNLLRRFDRSRNFPQKYPLGTIHLLMYILENKFPDIVKLNPEGLASVFFADGVWKILFKYTTNVLDWFTYLHSGSEADWWKKLKKLSTIDLIKEIDAFLATLKLISPNGKQWYGHVDLVDFKEKSVRDVLSALSNFTGWSYVGDKWNTNNFKNHEFTKKIYGQPFGSKSNAQFFDIWRENPVTLAMTEGAIVQYTIEYPDKML